MTELPGNDSTISGDMLTGESVYCFYTDGIFANGTAVKLAYPGKKYVGISPSGAGFADCIDIETGDAVPGDAAPFVTDAKPPNLNKPMIYASLSIMPEIINLLTEAGIVRSRYYLFLADWNLSKLVPNGYDAVQYQNLPTRDLDTFQSYIFKAAPVVKPPVHCNVSWEGSDGLVTRSTNIPMAVWDTLVWGNPF